MTEVRALVVPDGLPRPEELLGMVAYYDHTTRCGLIVTNDCRIGTTSPYPGFRAEERDFIEYAAKTPGTVVVFSHSDQYATNIRRYRKCTHDYELALDYYGSHEFVEIDGAKTNMLRKVHIPSTILTERVLAKIEREQKRSPESTAQRFRFMMRHFPILSYVGRRYAFDRDFAEGTDEHWQRFFDALSDDEIKAIMNNFPSVGNFVHKPAILSQWAASWHPEPKDKACMQSVKWHIHIFDEELQPMLLRRIYNAASQAAEQICNIDDGSAINAMSLRRRLLPYALLAGTDFRALIAKTLRANSERVLNQAFAQFKASPNSDNLQQLSSALTAHGTENTKQSNTVIAEIEYIAVALAEEENIDFVAEIIEVLRLHNEDAALRVFSAWLKAVKEENIQNGITWPEWFQKAGRKYAEAICGEILALDFDRDADVRKAAWLCIGLADSLFDEETQQTIGFHSPAFNRLFDKLEQAGATRPRLRAVLWAAFNQSTASKAEISSIFALLPPVLQVRAVRRIGLRIAYHEVAFTAEELYRFLSGAGRLCVELEIMFGYLRFRDARPQQDFNEDHLEAILKNCADRSDWQRIYALAPDANIDHLPSALWYRYTLLDFMRLLKIPYSATLGGRHYVNAHYTRFRVVLNEFAYRQENAKLAGIRLDPFIGL